METKRTFLAIDVAPQDDIIDLLQELKRNHKLDSIKWVDPAIMHLTLFFLGDTPIANIPDICDKLKGTIQKFEPFSLTLKGIGFFGRPLPRVIWVGVDFSEVLNDLKLSVDSALSEFGYSFDKERFNPHFTLGRVKFMHNTDKLNAEVQQYRNKSFQVQTVRELVLYESILKRQGPEYRIIQKFQLKGC
ncbi:MAG TPA: RNA 2',3'-cyclic phosphodiesterase [Bacteroidales bacterium]|nr:RNA 2',3'-cyclic phosphodiesterase [Bacteroidales bacterium]